MLETKEVEAVVVPAVAVEASVDEKADIEAKATSLRRAATALLFFSVIAASASTFAGILGMLSGGAVLCASSSKLLCRARCSRFMAFLTAIIAGYALVSLVSKIHAGVPMRIGDGARAQCLTMPEDTFEWGRQMLIESAREHKCMRKGLAFLSRHMPSTNATTLEPEAPVPASEDPSMDVTLESARRLDQELTFSQPEACDKLAYIVTCATKSIMVFFALTHLLLFLSAVAVVKRACRLRCAAYKSGLLEWKTCRRCKWAGRPASVASTSKGPA